MTSLYTVIFCIIFIIRDIYAKQDVMKPMHEVYRIDMPVPPDGMTGVASFAGFTSRNGRVSAIEGVKLFPYLDRKPFSLQKNIKEAAGSWINKNMDFEKGTIGTKDIATEFIKFHPDFVTGSLTEKKYTIPRTNPWEIPMDPIYLPVYDIFEPPANIYNGPQNIQNWIHKDVFGSVSPKSVRVNSARFYPNVNPLLMYT